MQPFGERSRQPHSRPTGRLDGPQRPKNAQDHQTDQRERVEHECVRYVAVKQRGAHPGATAERAVPTGQRTERTRQSNTSGRVEHTESEAASKERSDISGCARGRKAPHVGGNRHLLIVPATRVTRAPAFGVNGTPAVIT